MRGVVELLEEIGLGHYAETFRAHAIDRDSLVAPLYGWFTEGFATPDLTSAKALLDELAG